MAQLDALARLILTAIYDCLLFLPKVLTMFDNKLHSFLVLCINILYALELQILTQTNLQS